MTINLEELAKHTQEEIRIGAFDRANKNEQNFEGVHPQNILNDLSLKEWVRHTRSIHSFSQKHRIDPYKTQHPATFEEEFVYYYLELFSRREDVIFDPFVGTGTTVIVANLMGRLGVGTELNPEFVKLAQQRLKLNKMESYNNCIICGDSIQLLANKMFQKKFLDNYREINVTITSPPYFNILKRSKKMKGSLRSGGLDYGEDPQNLENGKNYSTFLQKLVGIFVNIYEITQNKGYLVIEVQNYYTSSVFKNGQQGQCIQFYAWDLAHELVQTRWIPCGEQIWCFPNKKCFPFGFPALYQSNIHHSYVLIFHKDTAKK